MPPVHVPQPADERLSNGSSSRFQRSPGGSNVKMERAPAASCRRHISTFASLAVSRSRSSSSSHWTTASPSGPRTTRPSPRSRVTACQLDVVESSRTCRLCETPSSHGIDDVQNARLRITHSGRNPPPCGSSRKSCEVTDWIWPVHASTGSSWTPPTNHAGWSLRYLPTAGPPMPDRRSKCRRLDATSCDDDDRRAHRHRPRRTVRSPQTASTPTARPRSTRMRSARHSTMNRAPAFAASLEVRQQCRLLLALLAAAVAVPAQPGIVRRRVPRQQLPRPTRGSPTPGP